MIRASILLLCGCAAVLSVQNSEAHEGEAHAEPVVATSPPTTATNTEKPQRLANGDLYVPKSIQRLLGIRTETFLVDGAGTSIKLQGEIAARPEARMLTSAPQAGVLEAPEGGWPQPGTTVKAGQILAYLQPQMTQRDAAKRVAQSADFEQRVALAEINAERLRLQSSAIEGQSTSGNVYYEQAITDLDAAKQQRDEVLASLNDRLPLRAAVSGVLIKNNLRSGEMVATGQAVFEVSNPTQLRVIAYSFDPRLAEKVQSANLTLEGLRRIQLRLRGQELLMGKPGWRLLFDVTEPDTNLSAGMPVNVELNVATDSVAQQLAKACVIGQANAASVWLHTEPERFVLRKVAACDAVKLQATASTAATINQFKPGDRLVVAGAALLSQYH